MTKSIFFVLALSLFAPQTFASGTVECTPLLLSEDEASASATFYGVGSGQAQVSVILPTSESQTKKYSGKCTSVSGSTNQTCRIDVSGTAYAVTLTDRGTHGLVASYAPADSMEIPELLTCH